MGSERRNLRGLSPRGREESDWGSGEGSGRDWKGVRGARVAPPEEKEGLVVEFKVEE